METSNHSHFIRGKISLTPMETILIVSRKLEYFEGLVKLAIRRKDVETSQSHVVGIIPTPTVTKVCINKTNHNKTFHLVVEIKQALLEGLIDNGASMSIMVTSVVREFNIMHLVSGHEIYKIASSIIT